MEITSGQPNISLGGNGMGCNWGIMFLAGPGTFQTNPFSVPFGTGF